ncbi:MAG: SixA phosphatase family protein [Bacteroidia bacterium]
MQTRHILIVRHSFAESAIEKSDFERALTTQGVKLLNSIGNKLLQFPKPELVHVSAARRTQQTFEQLNHFWQIDQHKKWNSNTLYNGVIDDYYNTISETPNGVGSIAIIAHNPTISYFANSLCSKFLHGFAPGNVLWLTSETSSWDLLNAKCQMIEFLNESKF